MTSGSCSRESLLCAVLLCTALLLFLEKYRYKAERKLKERTGDEIKTKQQAPKSYFLISLFIILCLVGILEDDSFDLRAYSYFLVYFFFCILARYVITSSLSL